MKYKFGNTSKKRLKTCHKDLQLIFEEAIKLTDVDFGIASGHRTIKEQQDLYAQGRTKPGSIVTNVDGVNKKSKHNYNPSMAVDIFAYFNNKAQWDEKNLCYLAGLIMGIAKDFKKHRKITHELRWGGNWDRDGVIISDQKFQDLPHFELI